MNGLFHWWLLCWQQAHTLCGCCPELWVFAFGIAVVGVTKALSALVQLVGPVQCPRHRSSPLKFVCCAGHAQKQHMAQRTLAVLHPLARRQLSQCSKQLSNHIIAEQEPCGVCQPHTTWYTRCQQLLQCCLSLRLLHVSCCCC